jgi:hypothetical protein
MGAKSRRKGVDGELEAAAEIRRVFRTEARRGRQYQGTDESPDVLTGVAGVHFEVKRTEALRLYGALAQASEDAGDGVPVVLHRASRKPWVAMSLGGALGTVRTDELATLRAMLGGISMVTKRRTIHEEMELLEKHRAAVQFAHQHLAVARPAGIANSMTRAVVARAWYCVTLDVFLTRFCEVLRTGIPACDAEHVVVLLRDQLTGLRNQRTTSAARQRQYALTSRALSAYLRSESLSILRAPTFELFPLPEEVDSAA